MRERLIRYWWLWVAIAVIVIVANELIDRGTGSGSHPAADILIAVAIVALSAFVWDFMARRNSKRVP